MNYLFSIQDPTKAEALLCEAIRNGEPLNLAHESSGPMARPDCTRKIIRAFVLRRLLLSDSPVEPGALRQLDLTGAIIRGPVDLRFATIDYPLRFTGCTFAGPVRLTEARLRSVSLSGCYAPGIDARHVSVDGDLVLEGATLSGPLRLSGAHLADDLHLDGASLRGAHGEPALDLDNIGVKGKVEANRMVIRGAVRMESAWVAGTLRLKGTIIDVTGPARGMPSPGDDAPVAWYGDGMTVQGEVDASGLRANGTISLVAARVLDLVLRGATVRSGGKALVIDRLDAGGTVCCDEGGSFTGGIRAVGIHVGSTVCLRRATVTAGKTAGKDEKPVAVDLRHAKIAEDLICTPGFSAAGKLDLAGAHISGQVYLTGADLRPVNGRGDQVLNASRAEITGDLRADDLTATGVINLVNTAIKGSMTLKQRKDGENTAAIVASGLSVTHDVALDTAGTLDLSGAEVVGDITVSLSRLNAPGNAAAADLAFIGAGVLTFGGRPQHGCVDLTNARIHLLCDDPRSFSDGVPVVLDGFEYDKIAGLGEESGQERKQQKSQLHDRLEWLAAGTRQVRGRDGAYLTVGFVPQPYQQLAAVYERAGQDGENRAVLRAMYQRRNKVKTPPGLSKVWNKLQNGTVGYGYAPRRALACLLALAVVAAVIFPFIDHARLTLTEHLFLPVGLLLPGTAYKDLAPWDTRLGAGSYALAAVLILSGLVLGATVLAALTRRIKR